MFLKELLFENDLTEAKGVFGRSEKDAWEDAGGVRHLFMSVNSYPDAQTNGGQFESPEQRDQWIADFESGKNSPQSGPIEWTNVPNKSALAVGILHTRTSDGIDTFVGRYFKKTDPNMIGKWANNALPAGWKLATSAGAAKLDAGLDPQHLIGNENKYTGAASIISTVNKNLQGRPEQKVLVDALNSIAAGQVAEFPGMRDQMPVLRDYFGEIMGPIALMSGMVSGDADVALRDLGAGGNWNNMPVFWPQAMNYNLVDSVFIAPDGKEIGISSKGAPAGAAASAKNLFDSLKKNKDNKELMDGTKFVAEIVTAVQENSAQLAPFILGEKLGLISTELKTEAGNLIKSGATDLSQVSTEAANLLAPYEWKTETAGFNVGLALISAVAKAVANQVNKDPRFSEQALKLLNTASIVQLYTKLGVKGDSTFVSNYKALYPPNFKGRVVLDGGKNYYSSRIGGKFAFKFV
jgi:hypothetical protein